MSRRSGSSRELSGFVHRQGPLRQFVTACCTPRVRASTSNGSVAFGRARSSFRCLYAVQDRGVCLPPAHTDISAPQGLTAMYNMQRKLRSIEAAHQDISTHKSANTSGLFHKLFHV